MQSAQALLAESDSNRVTVDSVRSKMQEVLREREAAVKAQLQAAQQPVRTYIRLFVLAFKIFQADRCCTGLYELRSAADCVQWTPM